MRDFIFIIGPSGIGKTTLAKELYNYYKGVYIEQNMIPEFHNIGKDENEKGLNEEKTLWEATVSLLKKFNSLGYKNIVGLDFDDLRTREIPIEFKGYNYITIKLISSDYNKSLLQMKNRGDGLINEELLKISTEKINSRPLLINEFNIDINGKTKEQVFEEVKATIENSKILIDYNYKIPNKDLFYSWVKVNELDK